MAVASECSFDIIEGVAVLVANTNSDFDSIIISVNVNATVVTVVTTVATSDRHKSRNNFHYY